MTNPEKKPSLYDTVVLWILTLVWYCLPLVGLYFIYHVIAEAVRDGVLGTRPLFMIMVLGLLAYLAFSDRDKS